MAQFEMLQSGHRSGYRQIVDVIATAIESGGLKRGEQLPTQRELAHRMKAAVATVGRAYAELEARGLINSHVGRGTFVAVSPFADDRYQPIQINAEAGPIDMAAYRVSVPPFGTEAMRSVLEALAAQDPAMILAGGPTAGTLRHRTVLAKWLKRQGVEASPDQVTITNGGQHANMAALATLTHHGDLIATEELTDPRMKAVASYLDRRLLGISCDDQGMIPSALEKSCREHRVSALYCAPRLQNPFNVTLPTERRAALVEIARRFDIPIIENDIYGTILNDPAPPIFALAPERTYYLTSLGRIAGPGLKVGCLVSPPDQGSRAQAGVGMSTGTATVMCAEVAVALIEAGHMDRMTEWQRQENRRRADLMATFRHLSTARIHPASPHAWISLPSPWRAEDFVDAARRRGVVIAPTHGFVADRRSIPHAVRLCLGAPATLDLVDAAFRQLERLLSSTPRSSVEAA
ncbi:PLP-dependent aminotransferase family protein [Acidisoma cellulosilytica]|uniref:PLP-dependent aminotransferase family protein n=1 Tax=Acidisoma cellulosilyticum TaxID=2802395 RepID=A0A964E636_9PROT|nr:PLP-dependent aminotransferase family protein [Acidisoma cellulosilyticum]MCB8882603.1 PLP-dependent aminotransferase family protein [Acidisoma cellulosilyticum]